MRTPRSLASALACVLTATTLAPTAVLGQLVDSSSSAVAAVYNDITTIDTNVKRLIAATSAFSGNLLQEGPILIDFVEVHLATRKGYYDSLTLPDELSTASSESLITHVNNTLSVDNPAAVKVLESKKSYFEAQGLDPLVKASLQLLLSDHLAFSDEVLKRLPAELRPQGQAAVDVITNALESGVQDFSS